MQYPEDRIKQAILHPEIAIRDRAASYFGKAYSPDPTLMPLVIQAVEQHGRQKNAYQLIGAARDLCQTEATIAWVIDELNAEASDQHENYTYNLSMILAEAEPALLLPRQAAILEARHFFAELRAPLIERLDMLARDFATGWRKLEEFADEARDEPTVDAIELGHARRIVEALARHGRDNEAKVRAILSQEVTDDTDNPMLWLEPLAVRLAGRARVEAAVPLIIAKLLEDSGDITNEECAEALTRIGTPAVLEAVAEAYPAAPHHFRLYAITPLEHIHGDLAVAQCVGLLAQEPDLAIRRGLIQALLTQFASEGIEAARQFLRERKLDFQDKGLRDYLIETCMLTGERFPEYDAWLAVERAEAEEHQRRMAELAGNPEGMVLYALEKLTGKTVEDLARAMPPLPPGPPRLTQPPPPRLTLPGKLQARAKAGRNDRCPCGSGKKYKHCCMKR